MQRMTSMDSFSDAGASHTAKSCSNSNLCPLWSSSVFIHEFYCTLSDLDNWDEQPINKNSSTRKICFWTTGPFLGPPDPSAGVSSDLSASVLPNRSNDDVMAATSNFIAIWSGSSMVQLILIKGLSSIFGCNQQKEDLPITGWNEKTGEYRNHLEKWNNTACTTQSIIGSHYWLINQQKSMGTALTVQSSSGSSVHSSCHLQPACAGTASCDSSSSSPGFKPRICWIVWGPVGMYLQAWMIKAQTCFLTMVIKQPVWVEQTINEYHTKFVVFINNEYHVQNLFSNFEPFLGILLLDTSFFFQHLAPHLTLWKFQCML